MLKPNKLKRNWLIFFSTFLLFHISCSESVRYSNDQSNSNPGGIKYAKAFRLTESNGYKVIQIINPEDSSVIQEVSLSSNLTDDKLLTISKPPSRIVLLSTSYVAYLQSLNELTTICGVSNSNLIYSENIKSLINAGKIRDIGSETSINMEVLIEMQPDLVLYYNIGSSTSSLAQQIKQYGIPVLFINEFQETTPLGKAEWIKFFGLIFNKDEEANEIFTGIEEEYLELLKLTDSFTSKPSVFTGLPWKGQWYQPGGNSFQAQFFKDAGANYLWSDDDHVAGITIDREVVFDKALNADFWLHPSNSLTLHEISQQDSRYQAFSSFKNGAVYNNNRRLNKDMGNDYWESAIMKPQVVLKDLMTIFHPEAFTNQDLVYYQKLN